MSKYVALVRRDKYQNAPQYKLPSVAFNIYQMTSKDPVYAPILGKLQAELLKSLDAYRSLLATALNSDTIVIYSKNEAKLALINVLDRIADALDNYDKVTVVLILNSGNDAQEKTGKTSTKKLEPPVFTKFESNGKRGQIAYACVPGPKGTKVIGEFRVGDAPWISDIYFTKPRGVIEDLPALKEVTFRFRTIGSNNEKSAWSDEFTKSVA